MKSLVAIALFAVASCTPGGVSPLAGKSGR